MQQNASAYRGDPSRLYAWGASAGGHLALMLAYSTAGIDAVVSWSGPTDLTETWRLPRVVKLLGCHPVDECPELARSASPVHGASADVPPTFIAHAEGDRTVPVWHADRLDARLIELEVEHEFLRLPGKGHAGGISSQATGPSFAWLAGR